MNEYGQVFRAWASLIPCVRKVSIFGSRCKGTFRDDSDLDVAIEIDPMNGDETAYATWHHEKKGWHAEIQPKLDVVLDLEWFDLGGSTPHIATGLSECSVVVYERAS